MSFVEHSEQTAINKAMPKAVRSATIALYIERLVQDLSLPSKLQQLASTIEQFRKLIEAQQNVTVQKPIDEPNVEQEPLANQKSQALEQQRLIYRQK